MKETVCTDLDSWYPEARNLVSVPKAHTGCQQDRLIRGKLCDDLVDVGIGEIRWGHEWGKEGGKENIVILPVLLCGRYEAT